MPRVLSLLALRLRDKPGSFRQRGAAHIVKNGKNHNGKQNHRCNDCLRQFVADPQNKTIDEATKPLIGKLLLEKILLALTLMSMLCGEAAVYSLRTNLKLKSSLLYRQH